MNPNNTQPYQRPQPEEYGQPTRATQPQAPINPNIPSNNYSPQTPYPAPSADTEKGMLKGRLNRIGFLLSFVYIFIYFLIPFVLQLALRGSAIVNLVTIVFGIVGVLLVVPVCVSIGVRRWHDLNQSGWLMLLGLVPFVGLVLLIFYLFVPGTKGINNYGEPDDRSSSLDKVLFGR